ncbi:spore germination protein [Cytobacillus firmus]|nr:spore germination protein [Cytobacillus firmus]
MWFRKFSKKIAQPHTNPQHDDTPISYNRIISKLKHTEDFKERKLSVSGQGYVIFYIESLVEEEKLEKTVIEPLTKSETGDLENELFKQEIKRSSWLDEGVIGLLKGNCLLMKENGKEGLLLNISASHIRDISEPFSERIVNGSHEGFVEALDRNIYLLRKRIETSEFTVKKYALGSKTNTQIAIIYLQDFTSEELVQKIDKRIKSITMDTIQAPGFIQDCIEDSTYSPFPQLLNTERPDRAAANLMEGRVALLMEGSPSVFILPVTITAFFQSPEDYNNRWYLGSFFRILRLICFILTLVLPAFYIAVVSFHLEIIPIELVYSLQSSLSYVPFPPIIEASIMQISLEFLKEASIRLPQPIAQTIGIVGALIIGTAMVEAGLVSNAMIIVVALTAVSSFVLPNIEMSNTTRILGFPLMILAAAFGFFGIVIGLLILFIHLAQLRSFGVPYFAPFAPLRPKELKDTFIRVPIWLLNNRPEDSQVTGFGKEKQSREWKQFESEDSY